MRLPADIEEWFVAACLVGCVVVMVRALVFGLSLLGALQWAGF